MTLLADNQPKEVRMARIISRLAKGGIMPVQGSIGVGMLTGKAVGEPESAAELELVAQ
jgi:hypothetical protein